VTTSQSSSTADQILVTEAAEGGSMSIVRDQIMTKHTGAMTSVGLFY